MFGPLHLVKTLADREPVDPIEGQTALVELPAAVASIPVQKREPNRRRRPQIDTEPRTEPAPTPDTPVGALVGYARVSTRQQDPKAQIDQLRRAGCSRIFIDDGITSRRQDRPELLKALDYVREHDTLVVCRLDRLGGDIVYLVELGRNLDDRGVKFWSISEGLDSRTPIGKAQFGMFAVFAELRLALIQEAVNDGLELARAQGRTGGRPRAVTDEQLAAARILIEQGTGVAEVARSMKIGRATLYRALGR